MILAAVSAVVLLTVPTIAADRDGDGLKDRFERRYGVTDPRRRDSDWDGVIDSAEDNDGDRLSNLGEQRFKTHPGRRDTDRNGKPDGKEDSNGNGINNANEQDRRPVPAGLRPTLAGAFDDRFSGPPAWLCNSVNGESFVDRCNLGDARSGRVVAIFGDSHALQWVPALDRAGKTDRWRLVTLLKSACPSVSVEVAVQVDYDGGVSCRRWRRNALKWLRKHPPKLIIVSNSNGYELAPANKSRRRWKKGMATTLAGLPRRSKVMVLGDAPNHQRNPVKCLEDHPTNMAACARKWVAPSDRRFHDVERLAAKAAGASFRTLYDKVCSYSPCPLVQGDILIWRDGTHMTRTFVKRLAPSFVSIVREEIGRR